MDVNQKIRNQLAFFGVSPENVPETRAAIFKQIHQIVFHGKGGYDWHTVYNMPIWLRRFTFIEIQKFYADEKSSYENQGKPGSKTVIGTDGKVKAPEYLSQAKRPAKYS
jgi:hypothetical protein